MNSKKFLADESEKISVIYKYKNKLYHLSSLFFNVWIARLFLTFVLSIIIYRIFTRSNPMEHIYALIIFSGITIGIFFFLLNGTLKYVKVEKRIIKIQLNEAENLLNLIDVEKIEENLITEFNNSIQEASLKAHNLTIAVKIAEEQKNYLEFINSKYKKEKFLNIWLNFYQSLQELNRQVI